MAGGQGKDAEGKRSAEKKAPPAPEPAQPGAAAPPVVSLKQAVALRARRFLNDHFSADAGGSGAETEGVLKLRYGPAYVSVHVCRSFSPCVP